MAQSIFLNILRDAARKLSQHHGSIAPVRICKDFHSFGRDEPRFVTRKGRRIWERARTDTYGPGARSFSARFVSPQGKANGTSHRVYLRFRIIPHSLIANSVPLTTMPPHGAEEKTYLLDNDNGNDLSTRKAFEADDTEASR